MYNKLDDALEKKIKNVESQENMTYVLMVDGEEYYYQSHTNVDLYGKESHYAYPNDNSRKAKFGNHYHYFKMEPIKWRVLENANGKKTLMALMKAMACQM